ncbi:MAG: acyl-CoA synthetase, partial [Erythrobacter sp.]|nr:acyl-CoA synthetase [Erythrobacter sp.]
MGQTTALAAESFCEVVREHARAQGEVIAFTYAGEDITFAEIDAGADRVANGLVALGVKPGDRVAFLGK